MLRRVDPAITRFHEHHEAKAKKLPPGAKEISMKGQMPIGAFGTQVAATQAQKPSAAMSALKNRDLQVLGKGGRLGLNIAFAGPKK